MGRYDIEPRVKPWGFRDRPLSIGPWIHPRCISQVSGNGTK